MPQGSTRISKALTNLTIEYKNGEFIAQDVLRDIAVTSESDQYYVYSSDRQLPITNRANGALANMVTWEVSTSTYSLTEHSLKDVITKRDLNNAESVLQLKKTTMENLMEKIMLRQEYEAHKVLFTTTTFSSNATLTSATSMRYVTTTSAPIQQALSASAVILRNSGKMPSDIIVNFDGFSALKENQNLHERVKYVQKSVLTKDLLAGLFDVQNFHVGSASYNPAKEGETLSMTSVWGGDFLIGYFAPSPGLKSKTSASIFRQRMFGSPMTVKNWKDEAIDGEYIEVQSMYQVKPIATACAYLFKSAFL
jgi:hypothetical protein